MGVRKGVQSRKVESSGNVVSMEYEREDWLIVEYG